ncbi:hypothetical protein ACFQ60_39860 [Streptomyces zhihengii]
MRLHRAAAEAITRRAEATPFVLPGPLDVENALFGPCMTDLAALVPGVGSGAPGAPGVAASGPARLQW